MRPDDEADHRDADTGSGDEVVAKNRFAREGGNDFADHAHGRQNHDVHGRMRVEPEQVLEQNRIAAVGRVEKAEVKHSFQAGEQQGDGDDRSAQDEDDAGGVVRPNETAAGATRSCPERAWCER